MVAALLAAAVMSTTAPAPAAARPAGAPSPSRLLSLPRLRSIPRLMSSGHRVPLVGTFQWPLGDERFGTARAGHVHEGVDLLAASGTPVVVTQVDYQSGAGYYVVVDGARERYQYVYMHLREGSTRVRTGDRIATGERIADVGATGDAGTTHLHFEVWAGPWKTGGRPIDPLPLVRRWMKAAKRGAT
jgi:murein DD-endopeptidase MepM/ murein hydrolase activator NlpD